MIESACMAKSVTYIDFLEWVRQQRPSSKWVVDLITNVTFFVWKIRNHPIGRGTFLPTYIAENHGIAALDRNHNTGKPYEDNLRFFRSLADTEYYYRQYRDAGLFKKKVSRGEVK